MKIKSERTAKKYIIAKRRMTISPLSGSKKTFLLSDRIFVESIRVKSTYRPIMIRRAVLIIKIVPEVRLGMIVFGSRFIVLVCRLID